MKECILDTLLDELLEKPGIHLDEAYDLIQFHMRKRTEERLIEVKGDLEHAFLE